MTTNRSIKIIKRQERAAIEAAAENIVEPKKTAHEAARDVVATVSEWVSEFQQKRRTETAQAFKSLFSDAAPQPGKA